jgi:hypothetical protein
VDPLRLPAPEPALPLPERLGAAMLKACPPANPADAAARDAAAARLAKLAELIDAPSSVILWGPFDPVTGYPPAAARGLRLDPLVWVRGYLSLFSFSGTFKVRAEGRYTVLELPARFRARLPAGDYPYPFWHDPAQWAALTRVSGVELVFDQDELLAAYYKGGAEPEPLSERTWDGLWTWTDKSGRAQPRVSTFGYLLSKENPDGAALGAAYEPLAQSLRARGCIECHRPDKGAGGPRLLPLDSPVHAVGARSSIAPLLERTDLPAGDPHGKHEGGLPEDAARAELIKLARAFEQAAEDALSYESARRAVP